MSYNYTVADRFMKYVTIDTQSDPQSSTFPSTEKQKNLAKLLCDELLQLGLQDAEMDEYGYVFATIKSNTKKKVPTLCFCAHMDTAPDCSGTNVKPILHKNYNGNDIILPDDISQIITSTQHTYLKEKIGDDIVTASGTTLLGADDKAGIAIIMDFANFILQNPQIKHGAIRILFTPDEEVGRGVEKLNMQKLNADYAYTLDGGERGSIEGESFSADGVKISIHGVSAHPGYAKGKLVSAIKIASEIVSELPKESWSPETTENREGYVHPTSIEGNIEKVILQFIIRDFETENVKKYEVQLEEIVRKIVAKNDGAKYEFHVIEQYRNMKEILETVPFVMDYAEKAMIQANIQPEKHIIRGGTDGSRLSFMGLPCPNIFTGEMGIHSKHEYVSVQDMQKAVNTLVELVQVWEENTK